MSLYGDLPPPSNEGDKTPNKESSLSSSSSVTNVKPALPGIVVYHFYSKSREVPARHRFNDGCIYHSYFYNTSCLGRLGRKIQTNAQQEAGATKTKACSTIYTCRICCPIYRNNSIVTQYICTYQWWRLLQQPQRDPFGRSRHEFIHKKSRNHIG